MITRNEDIQVLRGIAVSLVVLFHSGAIPVPAGFLGVDVFFVISGFLITSHIIRDVDKKIFSLTRFYMRRARRLLPATYCTLLVTTLVAPFLLVPSAWGNYIKSLFGALTFTANMFLWMQTGYFEQAAAFKPLLHLWSLSIEEQYYLILPLLLLIAPNRWRMPLISATLLSSATLCVLLVPHNPSATFFLLPTRVWELMIGSFLAGIVAKQPNLDAPVALKVAATGIVVLIPFFPIDHLYPRFDAILVTCATAVLLTGQGKWLSRWPVTRSLSLAGDWSYSIYLVHWPLYAFAKNAFLGRVPISVALLLIPVSYIFGYLQYRYVEQRFQFVWRDNNSRYLRYIIATGLTVSSLVLLFPFGPIRPVNKIEFAFRENPGLDFACDYEYDFDNKPECRLRDEPRVALWGDSFAMQWAVGLADVLHGEGLIQITKTICGPVKQLAIFGQSSQKWAATFGQSSESLEKWAATCIGFNESALRYILTMDSIKTVVLSSQFIYYLNPGGLALVGDKVENQSMELVQRQLTETVLALRAAQKKVIIIAPVPNSARVNIGECLQRHMQGIFVFPVVGSDCSFSYKDYQADYISVIRLLRKMEAFEHVNVVWPGSVTCDSQTCAAQIGGIPIFRDAGHITHDASILLTRMLTHANKLDLTPAANAAEPETRQQTHF